MRNKNEIQSEERHQQSQNKNNQALDGVNQNVKTELNPLTYFLTLSSMGGCWTDISSALIGRGTIFLIFFFLGTSATKGLQGQ